MANWNEIKTKIEKTTGTVVAKTSEIADIAAKHVRLKAMDAKLSGKYEDLGRYYYKQLKNGQSEEEKITKLVADIEKLIADRKALREEIEADKQRRAEEKKAREEAKAAEDAQKDNQDTTEN
ncbi:MAG: hypothetical protein J6L85_07235 [Clostridia bacterium]|nr:hypothetical protein [Clostridia bacterium]